MNSVARAGAGAVLAGAVMLTIPVVSGHVRGALSPERIALVNGYWFDGIGFEARTMYSVNGRFASRRPARIDRTLDLSGSWIVPPFGEAHNHNIDGAVESRTRQALARYVADGVFYVKIQGNYPVSDELRRQLPMNRPDGPDVLLAQAFVTATGGTPMQLHEDMLLPRGYYPGITKEQLRDRLFITIDSEGDLGRKWPQLLALHPDFVKANLWAADEFDRRKDDARYFGMKGLDPTVLPKIVERAHRERLRVSVHITTATDFHYAVLAGVDEIVHSGGPSPFNTLPAATLTQGLLSEQPALGNLFLDALSGTGSVASVYRPVAIQDATLAARRGVVVVTTILGLTRSPDARRSIVRPLAAMNLRLLRDSGVKLVIGSDNVADTSVLEFEQLATLSVFNKQALIQMWTLTTPQAIFPGRRIGLLRDGYEASFLALAGNPLEDLNNVRRIKLRFKQGMLLP